MIWPWTRFRELEQKYAAEVAEIRRAADSEVAWLRAQIEKKDGLLLQAHVPEPVRHQGQVLPDLPQDIMLALDEVADPGSPLYHDQMKLAEQEIREGKEPGEVADGIRKGGDFDPFAN